MKYLSYDELRHLFLLSVSWKTAQVKAQGVKGGEIEWHKGLRLTSCSSADDRCK